MMFELTARELIAEIFLAGGAFFLLGFGYRDAEAVPIFTAGCMLPATVRLSVSCFLLSADDL